MLLSQSDEQGNRTREGRPPHREGAKGRPYHRRKKIEKWGVLRDSVCPFPKTVVPGLSCNVAVAECCGLVEWWTHVAHVLMTERGRALGKVQGMRRGTVGGQSRGRLRAGAGPLLVQLYARFCGLAVLGGNAATVAPPCRPSSSDQSHFP